MPKPVLHLAIAMAGYGRRTTQRLKPCGHLRRRSFQRASLLQHLQLGRGELQQNRWIMASDSMWFSNHAQVSFGGLLDLAFHGKGTVLSHVDRIWYWLGTSRNHGEDRMVSCYSPSSPASEWIRATIGFKRVILHHFDMGVNALISPLLWWFMSGPGVQKCHWLDDWIM